ncbi:uncharacterized protein LOC126899434 [Daktulosphaira vitifoliae]|uniref:uncharacterized protein LOC126899434 n=1 Tax=Daktulosphaira vitifoliae TaxID=58002 RepID=UPI0021AA3E41|nr:uncharacterized protein LOC126899434 [Daktulosphaira vitifoliae]
MKIFIANILIVLLVVLQKSGNVLTTSDISITDSDNQSEKCFICFEEIMNDKYQTLCCKKPVHFKCIDQWFDISKKCHLCRGIPLKVCSICQVNSLDDFFKSKCCGKKFHYKCLEKCFDKSKTCPQCIHIFEKCAYCGEYFKDDNYYFLRCCQFNVHFKCLREWIKSNDVECLVCYGRLILEDSFCYSVQD